MRAAISGLRALEDRVHRALARSPPVPVGTEKDVMEATDLATRSVVPLSRLGRRGKACGYAKSGLSDGVSISGFGQIHQLQPLDWRDFRD